MKADSTTLGSACASRAGCGVSPQQSLNFLPSNNPIALHKKKFAMAGTTPWPAHETCALPGIFRE
jgi:hypothetical protein